VTATTAAHSAGRVRPDEVEIKGVGQVE